ncbi:TPA: YopX family protein [Streptococcus suis]
MSRKFTVRFFDKDTNDLKLCFDGTVSEDLNKSEVCFAENSRFMYNTGMKDMDGKEIFEWDIVEMKPSRFSEAENYIVFRHYGGEYIIDSPDHDYPLWLKRNDVKVVGNVFENPELMDKDFVDMRMREV